MGAIDSFLDRQSAPTPNDNIVASLRQLAVNKDLRIFLTSITKYSKGDWQRFVKCCTALYGLMQSSLMLKEDSPVIEELLRVPHIAAFFKRISESDV